MILLYAILILLALGLLVALVEEVIAWLRSRPKAPPLTEAEKFWIRKRIEEANSKWEEW